MYLFWFATTKIRPPLGTNEAEVFKNEMRITKNALICRVSL